MTQLSGTRIVPDSGMGCATRSGRLILQNHEIDILEIPLTVMDGTLDQTYMRLGGKRKWNFIKMLIDRVAACHGCLRYCGIIRIWWVRIWCYMRRFSHIVIGRMLG